MMLFVFFFFTYFSKYNTLRLHACCLKWQCFIFSGWVIFHLYICHIFFIHSSIDGRLDCFCFLAIVNNAAKVIGVHKLLQISVFVIFRQITKRRKAGLCVIVLFLIFWGTSILFSIMAMPVYNLTNSVQGFPFLYILSKIFLLLVFFIIAILTGVSISLWFWFAFP